MRSATGRTCWSALLASAGVNVRATDVDLKGAAPPRPHALLLWAIPVGLLALLNYAGRFANGKPDPNVLYKYSTAVGALILYGIMLIAILAIGQFRRDLFAARRPRSWGAAAGWTLVVLVVIFVSLRLIDPLVHGAREQGLTPHGWQPDRAGAYAANFVVIAVVAPIVEELTFRGLGFTLFSRYGIWTAILLVGVTFALAHGLVEAFPELFIFGASLAWLRNKVDSVYPGMVVHGALNGLALIAAVTTHH
jgi:membrane protease YdiL (CAAX protease family)